MAETARRDPTLKRAASYRGGLARSLVRTLLALTFLPLALMGAAAYLRSRTLLRDQVVAQMRSQIQDEVDQVDLSIKTKEIRLDRLMRSPDFVAVASQAATTPASGADLSQLRSDFTDLTQALSPQGGKPIFNQYLLIGLDGTVELSSKPEWEGTALRDLPIFTEISTADHETLAAFDVSPLYPKELVLMTVAQTQDSKGTHLGSVVGVTESGELQGILQSLSRPTTGAEAFFVTPSGAIIGTDPYTNQMTPVDAAASETTPIVAALTPMMNTNAGEPASVEFTDKQGARSFGQVLWLNSIKAGIVYGINEVEVFGPLNSLIPFTVAIFVAALAAMGGVLTLGATRVFGPLATLADITGKFAEGDFTRRAEVRSKDEIGLLAVSFNHMAEELSSLYRSLEQKVEERTRQMRTAAAVAERITSTTSIRDLLDRTARLLVEQFPFYQAGVFLLDDAGRYAVLEASYGPAAQEMLSRGHRLEVGSASIIGWVSANNESRIASDVTDDPFHLRNDLLPETRSEVGIPIAAGGSILGVLDVQSTQPDAFPAETVVMLQTLANQLAAAIQNIRLTQTSQTDRDEIGRVQTGSPGIVEAETAEEAFATAAGLLSRAPYPAVLLALRRETLELQGRRDPGKPDLVPMILALPVLEEHLKQIAPALLRGTIITGSGSGSMPEPFMEFARQAACNAVAFIPVRHQQELYGLMVLGSPRVPMGPAAVEPYGIMAELLGVTLHRIADAERSRRLVGEHEALTTVSQAIASSAADLASFYAELHTQIRNNVGEYAFFIALLDPDTKSIVIPYAYQDGRVQQAEGFPLGESLTSVVMRTGQPLLLLEDVEQQAIRLGVRPSGRIARSWMGVPLIAQDATIGALVLEDPEREHAFRGEQLKFMIELSKQAAAVVQGARLLTASQRHTYQLETAAEIARDISMSLDLDELLAKSVDYLRERFGYYHAAVFLIDARREYAVIREATGDAGAQMKSAGHRLGVGSRSIVGYASSRGEPLIVNDTNNDATYYANPLLPNTRAEAAVPLRVGERIVGVMDVQSDEPNAFKPDDVRTLQILADQLAVAVVNSELFAETQEHLAQHRLLHHITTSAASGATLDEALQSAVEGLQVTLGGDRVSILMPERGGQSLEVKAAVGYSQEVMELRVPLGSGITGWSAAHQQVLRVPDVASDPRYIEASPNTRSELAIPLVFRNELLGVLNVESERPDAYTLDDEEMLSTLGGSLAAIIANARLLARVRAQAERERAIYEISGRIRRATDVRSVLETTATELTKAVGARRAQIRLSPEPGNGEAEKGER
jgi:GAF domain-containing protein/HAMP domain-containing protein